MNIDKMTIKKRDKQCSIERIKILIKVRVISVSKENGKDR